MAIAPTSSPRCAARSRSPPSASAAPAPTRASAPSSSTRPAQIVGEGHTAPAGGPHAEVVALPRGRRPGPRRHRRRHARTLQPHRPHRPLHRGADRRRHRPRGRRGRAIPTRSPPAGSNGCAPAGRRRRGRGTRRPRPHHGLRYWLTAIAPGPPVRDLEVRRHPGRPQRRRRRHQPVDHLRDGPGRRARAARHRRRDHRRRRHRARRRRPADRPVAGRRCDRQPLRVVVDSRRPYPARRPGPRRRRAHLDRDRRGRSAPAATAGSTCAALLARRCTRRGVRGALLEGGPTLAGAFLRGRSGRRGRRLHRAEAARRRRGRARPTPASTTIADAIDLEHHRRHPDRAGPAADRGAEGSPIDVHRNRRGTRRGRRASTDLGDAARLAVRGAARHRRRGPRRLDRGQRRLPDRRRRRRRRVHRRRDEGDARPLVARRAAPSATGQPGAGRDAVHPARRPPGAGPRRRRRHDRRPQAGRAVGDRHGLAAAAISPGTSSRRARSPSTASR